MSELSADTAEQVSEQKPNWTPVNTLFRSSSCTNPRYDIGRTTFYEWIKAAKIAPYKRGNKSYVDFVQLERLDELNEWIAEGLSLEEFQPDTWLGEQPGGAIATTTPSAIEQQAERVTPKAQAEQRAIATIDPNRIQAKAITQAKEDLIAATLAQSLIENPELLPEDDWDEINQVAAVLQSRIPPKPKASPDELADQFLAGLGLAG